MCPVMENTVYDKSNHFGGLSRQPLHEVLLCGGGKRFEHDMNVSQWGTGDQKEQKMKEVGGLAALLKSLLD